MASCTPSYASTKETTNYARLCRLLVDAGSQALRNKFDSIHPPTKLHGVLTKPPAHPALQTLRTKKILNPTQWAKLYPSAPSSVSSQDFDVTLLMLLLRNICGLAPPATGWDNLPPPADTSDEANIARVKYYRNHVYGHASRASVDDPMFNSYWQDISNALVGLGADAAAISKLKTESMDPIIEKHYQELLREWKKDDDNNKDRLDEIEKKIRGDLEEIKIELGRVGERLHILEKSKEQSTDQGFLDTTEFIDGIRQLYNNREGWLAPFLWLKEFRFSLDNIFTKLRIVSRKKERGSKTNETVTMDDIFKPHEECQKPRTVLIEGNPGMGKTTYCNKLAYDWATKKQEAESSFPKFQVVLLLTCREIRPDLFEAIEDQRQARSVKAKEEELLKSVLWDAIDDQLLLRDVTKAEKEEFFKFIRHNQRGTLLVLDGLDELPNKMLPSFKEIIQGRMLPKCRIVATARHEVGMKVRECCDSLLEIEGFAENDTRAFVFKYFKSQVNLAEKLFSKLQSDENLRRLTKSPLNTSLLCLLCEDFDGTFPESGTLLYLEVVKCVLRRYRKKKEFPELEDEVLIEEYKTQLKQLGSIALNGLLHDNMGFEKSELKNCSKESPVFDFLSVERGRSKRKPSLYCSFLHKTFQELFAAFYICCQLLDNEVCPGNLLSDKRYLHELREVLVLSCGLLASKSEEMLKDFITSIANQVNDEYEFLLALKCIAECKNGKNHGIHVFLARTLGLHLHLTQLDLSKKYLSPGDCTALAEAIHHNSTITQLDLSGNFLGFGNCTALAEAIHHNSTITQLDLSYNKLGDGDCTALAEAIHHNSTITQLDLSANFLGFRDCTALAEAIHHNSTITQLDLSENILGFRDCTALAEAIHHNSTITQLDLSHNGLGVGDCTALAEAIHHNSTITQLNLSHTLRGLGDYTALAEAIHHNSTITQLNLSENCLGDGDLTALAEAIHHNSTITQLDLSYNKLGDGDCTALAEVIHHNSTITRLDLSGNGLGVGDCTALAEAIHHNSTITQLNLSENCLGDGDLTALAEAIHHNSTITQLNLSYNKLGDGNCTALAEAIHHNSTITQLNLSENGLGDGDLTALAEAIHHNSTITQLDLSNNDLGPGNIAAVTAGIKDKSTKTHLIL